MNKIRYWLAAIAVMGCVGAAAAQEQNPQSPQSKSAGLITRTVDVKYADLYKIVSTLNPIAKANGTIITADSRARVLLLTGSPERIGEMESLVRRLDIAPASEKNLELTVYLLTANDSNRASQNIPQQLDPALKQLRSIFNYKSYQVLDTIFMRNRILEHGSTSGFLAQLEGESKSASSLLPGRYNLSYGHSYLTQDDRGDLIHLDNVSLQVGQVSGISTNIDLRPGQMVVVGKSNFETGNGALIAVITARVVD
jgi:hypothetical protein